MRLVLPLLLFLTLSGTAEAGLFADNDARDEIVKLRKYVKEQQDQRITDLQARLDASEKARQALEQRVGDQKNQMIDLLAQIDRLNGELSKLRGQLEVNSHEIEVTQQRQKDLYADLDSRMRKLENGTGTVAPVKPVDGVAPQSSAPQSVATQSGATAPASSQPPDDAAEIKAYEAALELSKAAKHKESIEAFGKFLETYPGSKYAPSAQYWIGYAHFSLKNYKAAIADQQKLIKQYPENHKIPDALYNMANSQIQLNDIDGAKQSLREVTTRYPLSDVAPLAKKRLAVLDSIKPKK